MEVIKEETVVEEAAVEEVVAALEAAKMVIGFARTPGKLSFPCFSFAIKGGFPHCYVFCTVSLNHVRFGLPKF